MTHSSNKWGWDQEVSYYDVRKKWPQLANYLDYRRSVCHNDTDRVAFNRLVEIANGDGNLTIKTKDIVGLIVRFRVSSWEKPQAYRYEGIRYEDLTGEQKQKLAWLAYWLGINVHRESRNNAGISSAYSGKNGKRASVSLRGSGRAWKPGEKAQQWRRIEKQKERKE